MIYCKYNLFFKNFSSELRIKILEALEKGPLNVSAICEATNEEQSKISHNLKQLATCHFVTVEKKGKNHIYSLNEETIMPLMKIVSEHIGKNCTCHGKCKPLK